MLFGLELQDVLPFIAVGFAAQLVDGALGMAFGVISSTLLVSLGVPPATASATVHLAECFTTGVSGASHILHKNVNWKLLARLAVPGMLGGAAGAYLLSNIDASIAKPYVLAYLTGIGIYLLVRGIRHTEMERRVRVIEPLGLLGGFLDASGGGGWGPIVTSNLLLQGSDPRTTVGSVNTAEFFITTTISATFIFSLGAEAFSAAIVGLIIGGVIAAPLGAWLTKHIPARPLLIMVGVVLTLTSLVGCAKALKFF
ncbi:sulfite exporter TauE/SafE family protein [Aquisediminimonas sediminicola]|uniref:sulfite exporter TauE/SafE family protein n=1 Tax=Alteraquisediminimonas sediminicola TaxID=2676787 RepID=UPI001C8D4261|nr:sulfite exporter TauE/SafE family protein [Aquisediminimonas sediminicola]